MTAVSKHICGVRVDAVDYDSTVAQMLEWASRGESRMLCFATAHMVMEARDRPDYERVLDGADVVAPDGMALVWALRLLGVHGATRVYGPDFSEFAAAAAAPHGVPIGLYGGTPETLDRLARELERRYPGLRIAYAFAPPFRPLTEGERETQI